jgi:fumarate hydratase subunit beta
MESGRKTLLSGNIIMVPIMDMIKIKSPLDSATIEKLKAGDRVLISGVIYTARDAAHKRMVEALSRNRELPFDVRNQIIYYSGPTTARPGHIIGSIGPTTSGRMDAYAVSLLQAGLKGMIGKGSRSQELKDAIVKYKAVYFAAIGGAGALISRTIKKADVIAYEDLGTEAVHRLEVEDFPVVVVNDVYGGDIYRQGKAEYQIKP